jgi:hypothetical protein
VIFKPDAPIGNYSLSIKVVAIDNSRPGMPFISQEQTPVQISPAQVSPTGGQTQEGGILFMIYAFLRALFNAFFGTPSAFTVHSYFKAATAFILDARHAG